LALLAGGRLAHVLVLERALALPANDDLVVDAERVLDREAEIGKRCSVARDRLLDARAVLVAQDRVVIDVSVGAALVDQVEVSFSECVLDETSRDADVLCGGGHWPLPSIAGRLR